MGRLMKVLLFVTSVLLSFGVYGDPIETPDEEERNEFCIRSPDGWGYRTFEGNNGLIGTLWPAEKTFNSTDTAVFVFLQNDNEEFPEAPHNINIFMEKCPQASFHFFKKESDKEEEGEDDKKENHENDDTLSIAEEYFSGRCGRTMILFKEKVEYYTVIIALVSAKYVSKSQLADVKLAARAYRREIEKYLEDQSREPKS